MADREKVIKGLECCTDGFMMCKRERCPYYGKAPIDSTCRIELEKDALALLKEQEPVKPVNICRRKGVYGGICSKCLNWVQRAYNYCPFCGRKVKWDAVD